VRLTNKGAERNIISSGLAKILRFNLYVKSEEPINQQEDFLFLSGTNLGGNTNYSIERESRS
jgi:hypothetical protein